MSYRRKKDAAADEEKHFTFDHQTGQITAKTSGVIDFPAGMMLQEPPQDSVGTSAEVGAPQPGPVKMSNRLAQEFMFAPKLSTPLNTQATSRDKRGVWQDYCLQLLTGDMTKSRDTMTQKEINDLKWSSFIDQNDQGRLRKHLDDNGQAMLKRVVDIYDNLFHARFSPERDRIFEKYPNGKQGYTDDITYLGQTLYQIELHHTPDPRAGNKRGGPATPNASAQQRLHLPAEVPPATAGACMCAEPLLMPSLGAGMSSSRLWGGRGYFEEEDGYWSD